MTPQVSRASAEELFAQRNKRVDDAIALKAPDRIPVQLFTGYFPAKYVGVPCDALYYDAERWRQANRKTVVDFAPDTYWVQTAGVSGLSLELLGAQQIRWPGHGLPSDQGHQMVELEPMKENDYDAFLQDPSDFIVRTYLPRVWEGAAPLASLSPFRGLVGGTGLASYLAQFARPEMAATMALFARAAEAQAKWQSEAGNFSDEMAELGFPAYNAPRMMAGAPFDAISDNLRGMRGTMLDMYRQPDKLLEACEMLARQRIDMIRQTPAPTAESSIRRVFIALHRGSDGFTSLPQFERFYWPTLKRIVLALVDAGWTPCPFFEGVWDQRLEYIRELPKGKVLCHFAQTDPVKIKAVLGGHLCVMSDVPSSITQTGSVSDMEDYCKKMIDLFGKDGGFIMTTTCIDEALPENLKAMVDFTARYGRNG